MSGFEIDGATWAALNRLLDEVLDLDPGRREAWLEGLAPEYAPLKPRLRSLLSRAETPPGAAPALGTLPRLLFDGSSGTGEGTEEMEAPGPEVAPGDRLGPYEIRGLLGAGGMGQVYRAFDASLSREVAIKALAHTLRGDPASLLRVEREARVLANLNHPNIACIHGFERIDGAPYLILELVDGETLAERLVRSPLAPLEAAAVAVQLASALEEAHGKGVVHRDLKPSNLMLSGDGRVKVLDFGIAKAVPGPGALAKDAVPATATGLVRGTAPYLSPEQIRGEGADARADIWAFGCLLYEMLTRVRAFAGTSPAEVMAAVLRDEVDWTRLPPHTPAVLRRLTRRCLAREKADRLQDIGDARVELQEFQRGKSDESPRRPRAPRRRWLPWLVSAASLVLAAVFAVRFSRSTLAPAPEARQLGLALPPDLRLEEDYAAPFALTPDGLRLVLVGRRDGPPRLLVRDLGALDPQPLPGTEDAWQPFVSSDGKEVAFFADRKLKRVAFGAGSPLVVAETGDNPRGGAFVDDGSIVLAPSYNTGLFRIVPPKGAMVALTHLDLRRGESSHRWPQVLPGGRWALFTVGFDAESYDDASVEAVSLATGERRRLVLGGAFGRYAGGHLLYAQAGRLFAAPLDLDPPALRGEAAVVLESVRYDSRNGSTHLAVSRGDTMIYSGGLPASLEHHLAWVDLQGRVQRFEGPARRFREPRLSPDGQRVAVVLGPAASSDLWVADAPASTLTRVSYGASPRRPVWTPDGRGITVGVAVRDRFQLQTHRVAGGEPPVVLLESAHRIYPSDWSTDGRILVFQELSPDTGWDLRLFDRGSASIPGAPRDLSARPFQETNASLSPDGRLVAFESDELDGVVEIYVMALADPATRVRITSLGANWPRFGLGGELYYWVAPRVHPGDRRLAEGLQRIEVRLGANGRIVVGPTTPVWPAPVRGPALFDRMVVAAFAAYDVERKRPAGRFLALDTAAPSGPPPAAGPIVVLNGLGGPLGPMPPRP